MRIDLHTHSTVSDGTDTPAELIGKAVQAGLDVVALTDHDTADGLAEARAAAASTGIELMEGMEVSCRRAETSVHLLAYGVDAAHPALAAELAKVRAGRSGRLAPVLDKLAALGLPLSEEDVLRHVGDSPSVGRPHIADALVDKGYVRDRAEAFDRFLADGGPAHVARYAIELADGIDLVHDAGGVAVIAHPWGRTSRVVLPPDYLRELAVEHGLDGIEVDHHDHDADAREELAALCEGLGLLATGSSDYHGVGKVDHDLGCHTTDPAVYAELRRRLR